MLLSFVHALGAARPHSYRSLERELIGELGRARCELLGPNFADPWIVRHDWERAAEAEILAANEGYLDTPSPEAASARNCPLNTSNHLSSLKK